MARTTFNPASLIPILLNTGVQQDDPRMYQFLNSLINGLIQFNSLINVPSTPGGGGSVGPAGPKGDKGDNGIPGQDGFDGEDQFYLLTSQSSSSSSEEWSVLTNGDVINPELIYAGGDVIMLHTP